MTDNKNAEPNQPTAQAPNFFILGVQKAGTTFLAKALASHPDVFFTEPKEPMFFQRGGLTEADYQAYLHEFFAQAGEARWRGEGSTIYLQWPLALPQIKAMVPGDPLFFVCLRHPTEKAVSLYIHNWRRDRYEPGTSILDTFDMSTGLSVLKSTLVAPSLKRWFEVYPKERFTFILFDWLQEDPVRFTRAACDVLELDSLPPDIPDQVVNAGLPLEWRDGYLTIAAKAAANVPDEALPRFQQSELQTLHETLQSDVDELEAITGLDLSAWRVFPKLGK